MDNISPPPIEDEGNEPPIKTKVKSLRNEVIEN